MDSIRYVQTPYFMFDQHLESSSGFTDKNIATAQKWMQKTIIREWISGSLQE